MEHLSHSRQLNNAVSKKSYNGNTHNSFPTSAKTVYDDVFGGAPRFGGPPSLSPRVEDYAEIFGGLHALRASSIPVLNLPAVDEAEVFFDVRSAGFDYGEVFGGFGENDFAVSYEELVMMDQSDGRGDSSYEAWTPSEAEYPSDELEPSIEDQYLSNRDSYETINGSMEFNISYHKAGQRSNGVPSSGFTQIGQLQAVPGYSFMVDKDNVLTEKDKCYSLLQASDDGYLNIDLSREVNGRGQLRKTLSHPVNSIGELSFETDLKDQKRYVRNGSLPNETFVTISDVSLRTQPSDLPPPSRPPPPLDGKKRDSGKKTSCSKNVSSGGLAGDNSPPYFDVEVDVTSSAAASAAAIKEAMEQAQAKLRSAKELMERKRGEFQSRSKLGSKNDRKGKEEKVNNFDNASVSAKDERLQGVYIKGEHGTKFPVFEECQKVQSVAQQIGGSTEGQKHQNGDLKYVEEKQGRESLSSQESDRIDGATEGKEANQFFELGQTNKSGMTFGHAMNGDILVQHISIQEGGKKEKKTAVESFQQYSQQENKVNSAKAGKKLDEYEKQLRLSKEDPLREENSEKTTAAKLPPRQRRLESKVEMVQGAFRWEENVEMCGVDWQPVTTEKKKIKDHDLQKHENMIEIQLKKNKNEAVLNMMHKEKGTQPREAGKHTKDEKIITYDREDGQKIQKEAFQQDEHENKHKLIPEHPDYMKTLKETPEKNEEEKRMEVLEQETIAKKEKEAREREIKERRLRETLEREENKRLEKARVKEENERRLRDLCQKEDKERRGREAVELEENDKRHREAYVGEAYISSVNDTLDKLEDERRIEEVVKQEENLLRQKEACDSIGNNKRFQEALEHEDNDKKWKESREKEENEKKPTEDSRNESMRNRVKETSYGKDVTSTEFYEDYNTSEDGNGLADREVEEQEGRPYEKFSGQLEEACKKEKPITTHSDIGFEGHEEINKIGEDHGTLNQEDTGGALSASNHVVNNEILKGPDISFGETSNVITQPKSSKKEALNGLVDGKIEVSSIAQVCSEHEKVTYLVQEAVKSPYADEVLKKVGEAGHTNGQRSINIENTFPVDSNVESQGKKLAYEDTETGKLINEAKFTLNIADVKDGFSPAIGANESMEIGQKAETTKPTTSEVQVNAQRIAQPLPFRQIAERKVINEALPADEKEVERIKRQKELEKEQLRMIEEEREREREREKDRMAVDRVTLEVRERAYAEARERAERAAVERAMNEARERLEKACAEAREKSLDYRTSIEARLRAERAAVERATLEARGRAFGKVMIKRSVSEKFSASSWNSGVRPSSSSSDLQDLQSRGTSSSSGSRYAYTSAYTGSNSSERSEGVEHESAQRCKARLERHRRTAERVAKALAEKNMRDLLAQREQTERHRLAETLDADVKRWSTGKEGNLRALLSTLQYILGPDCGWQPIPLTEVITSAAVKKAYRKATLCVHPDKLQQRGASIQQKYICEKVFDLLKEAWNKFNSEER